MIFRLLVLASVPPSTSVPRPIYWFCVKSVDTPSDSTGLCVSLDFRTAPPIYWFCVKSVDIPAASTGQCVSLDFRTTPHLLVLRKVGRYSASYYWPVCFPRLPYRAAAYWFCVNSICIPPASTCQFVSLDSRTAPPFMGFA